MKRFCLALDLKNEPELISEYEKFHQNVWPGIIKSLRDSGVESMEIYRIANRLFMIMETNDKFSFSKKAEMDVANPEVQEWETLMWKFQQPLHGAKQGEKWRLMEKIFQL